MISIVTGSPRCNLVVHEALHLLELLGGELLRVGEVEAQALGGDVRAHLVHGWPQHLAQGRLQQVRGGVQAGGLLRRGPPARP